MKSKSRIYEGTIRHRRFTSAHREFQYRVFMMYVDLDELDTLFDRFWFWSAARRNVAWFRRSDYIGEPTESLADSIKKLIKSKYDSVPDGPIRLLTNFRYFGFSINPISLYYCFNANEEVEFVVAEVTNTPWGEKHAYVLDARKQTSNSRMKFVASKEMHVSPFLDMEYEYHFQMNSPDENLLVHIANHQEKIKPKHAVPISTESECQDGPAFDATLLMKQRPISSFNLARALVRFPMLSLSIFARIHWQAFRLWAKGVKVKPHPGQKRTLNSGSCAIPVSSGQAEERARTPQLTSTFSVKNFHEST